ncbi:MAG: ABC transporter transmembrane domain-containing protein, partial [Polaromonas sp.]
MKAVRSSRQRYLKFVEDYWQRRLDDPAENEDGQKPASGNDEEESASPRRLLRGNRREYLREYLHWLRPHGYAVGVVFVLALVAAGLEMIEPLFMRYIVDSVLLNAALESAGRLQRLHLAGAVFLGVIVVSNLTDALKDYRQRLLNVRVILSLRRALFDRLLHLPLAKLWDMKTGGILSRLTGDVETTTGLLQMAVVSPSISLIRLVIAVIVLTALNWRLALMALAIIPGIVLMSLI